MTPFFAVALMVLLMQAFAIQREVKNGGPVRDGGARLGIVLLLIGASGLIANYFMRGPTAMISTTDFMSIVQGAMLLAATFATVLSFKAMTRKSATA